MSTFETTSNEFTSAIRLLLSGNGDRPHDRKWACPLQQQGPAGILTPLSPPVTSLVVNGFLWITTPYPLDTESARITTASAATMPTTPASRYNTRAPSIAH